ncbi:MAG: excinuclease ABC subunit UvrA [Alistipes sp.]|nr:excinuclease ABC subunit UvrA [Candidatus Alistipes equi]
MQNEIHIKGARVHNLKNIEVHIPHEKLIVITGLSGSGKSTLAFDTIYAEGQRRYVESLSSYARQFLGRASKPDVDFIHGIAPAIAIQQKVNTRNPRSTVGTSTEIYDLLKLLFARIGHTFSPISGREVKCYDTDQVIEIAIKNAKGKEIAIAAPITLEKNQTLTEVLLKLMQDGIQQTFFKGNFHSIEETFKTVDLQSRSLDIWGVLDCLTVKEDDDTITRLRESISRAFGYGNDAMTIIFEGKCTTYSSRFEMDGIVFEHPSEHLFSFNNPIGACPQCEGYGKVTGIDEKLVIPDRSKSVFDNAIACWKGETMGKFRERLIQTAHLFNFPIHTPYHALSDAQRRLLWLGNEYFTGLDEFFRYLDEGRSKIQFRVLKARYTGKSICPLCNGSRLKKEALNVKIGGKNIDELVRMDIDSLYAFFESLKLDIYDRNLSERLRKEIMLRLSYLRDVGLGYLTLDRLSNTLSGGESQRINLATMLGSDLTGSLYILDEPSIGLHPRDSGRLISILKKLRDKGNTVIVVEHDEQIIRSSDFIIDMGPMAGSNGGEIVFAGPFRELKKAEGSLTAQHISGQQRIEFNRWTRPWQNFLEFRGCRENTLKNITVKIPLGVMTCITGVSGSGKSSLVRGIIYPALNRLLRETGDLPGDFDGVSGDVHLLSSVELIDQNPIGKSTRSNPVTYLKAYDEIRRLFAEVPYAKQSGVTAAEFSFNQPGGRCEECEGEGTIKVPMQFMADITLTCESCHGKRFKQEILDIKYREKSISDVLEMTVKEAIEFFQQDGGNSIAKRIVERLRPLANVGLDYVKLGQASSTLSGGESQRIKLASFLLKESGKGHILFIFDEPTTGLHTHDIKKLLESMERLINRGHTILVVEHNPDVIRSADHIIDLGPEGGSEGGYIVCEGTPQSIIEQAKGYTYQFLTKY